MRQIMALGLAFSTPLIFGAGVEMGGGSPGESDQIVIRPREEITVGQRQWLLKELKGSAYEKEAFEAAVLLSDSKLDEKKREPVVEGVRREPDRSGALFAEMLDSRRYPDARVRLGAVRAIEAGKPAEKVAGKNLALVAMSESVPEVRSAAIKVIKERRDTVALQTLMEQLSESDDNTGLGITNEKQRAAVLGALNEIGDKRVYAALLYFVTLELRLGVAKLNRVDTKFLTNSGDVNNGGVGQTTINLPIDLPELELSSFQGMITVPAIASPAFALRSVSGEDFGKDLKKWQDWINKQPDVRK